MHATERKSAKYAGANRHQTVALSWRTGERGRRESGTLLLEMATGAKQHMNPEYLEVDLSGPIATIALSRPEKLNALSLQMLAELELVAELAAQSDARAVVLYGKGSSFSAGMDLETFTDGVLFQTDADLQYDAASLGGKVADAIENIPQVTVVALQGNVVGGGIVLAAACDLRIAEEGTVFSIPEVDLGIPLAWGGIERLVREIGPTRTKEFVMTCRPFSVEEAQATGFINNIVGPGEALSAAMHVAETIAAKARLPITTTKRHIAEVLTGDTSRDDAMGLLAAIDDPECAALRESYVRRFRTDT